MPLAGAEIALAGALLGISETAGRDLGGAGTGSRGAEKELERLAGRILAILDGSREPRRVVSAVNGVLFGEERFVYDAEAGNPDNFLLDRVLARRKGNCLGISAVYLALAERLGIPLGGVHVPSHCFVRYDDGVARINIEPAEQGGGRSDDRYAVEFRVGAGRPYLATLGKAEFLGLFLKSVGAAYSRRGMEDKALETYRAAAEHFPGLPDAHYNAGVSHQKLGRVDEAIGAYRRALALDPDLAPAHVNLGAALGQIGLYKEALEEARKAVALAPRSVASRGTLAAALCGCGDLEGGIREYRRVLDFDPRDARALEGIARAYYSKGMYREAADACDRAMNAGCRFDSAMLEGLAPYRAVPGNHTP